MTYEIDVTPANDPLGTILTTFGDNELVAGTRFRPVKLGTGLINLVIDADDPGAGALDDDVYLRVRDTVLGAHIAGGFLTDASLKLVSETKDRRLLSWSGDGQLSYLARASFRETNFSTDPAASPDVFTRQPGMVQWIQQPWGAILVRAIQEGMDMPGNPLAALTYDFTRDLDSGGNVWTLIDESGFSMRIGTNILDLLISFIRQGLIPVMSPNLMLSAYEAYGQDHSGAAFGADVVRFQVGSDPNDLLANILTDVDRAWTASRVSHLLVIGGDGVTTALVTDPGAVAQKTLSWDYAESSDPVILAGAGQAELARRALRAVGALKLPIILGDDPLNGAYLPGPGRPCWPGNTGTAFTGSETYDIHADLPIAALDFLLTDRYGWDCQAELGSVYVDRNSRIQEAALRQIVKSTTPRAHAHPEMLCRPGTPGSLLHHWTFNNTLTDQNGAYAWAMPGSGGFDTDGIGGTDIGLYAGNLSTAGLGMSEAFPVTAGQSYDVVGIIFNYNSGQAPIALSINWFGGAGGSEQIGPTVAYGPETVSETVTVPTGVTSAAFGVSRPGGSSNQVMIFDLTIGGRGTPNDGHPDLIGPGTRIKRCSDTEHFFSDRPPTSADTFASLGMRYGTHWVQVDDTEAPTESFGSWMLTDEDAGTWIQMSGGGLSETDVQTLIDTEISVHEASSDPHTGYLLESDHTEAVHTAMAGLATQTELDAHAATAHGGTLREPLTSGTSPNFEPVYTADGRMIMTPVGD